MVDKIWYNMEELIGGSEERVLIETYWNVNVVVLDADVVVPVGINRNILECKLSLHLYTSLRLVVLIETYWNVNYYLSLPLLHRLQY